MSWPEQSSQGCDTDRRGDSQAPTALKHATQNVKVAKAPTTVRKSGGQNNAQHTLPFAGCGDRFSSDLAVFSDRRVESTRSRTATDQPADPADTTRQPAQL